MCAGYVGWARTPVFKIRWFSYAGYRNNAMSVSYGSSHLCHGSFHLYFSVLLRIIQQHYVLFRFSRKDIRSVVVRMGEAYLNISFPRLFSRAGLSKIWNNTFRYFVVGQDDFGTEYAQTASDLLLFVEKHLCFYLVGPGLFTDDYYSRNVISGIKWPGNILLSSVFAR